MLFNKIGEEGDHRVDRDFFLFVQMYFVSINFEINTLKHFFLNYVARVFFINTSR